MAIEKINIENFLSLAVSHPVLDVRSPGEYKHAHIPGAYSFPLFTDEERKIVGTAFKQQSREQAIKIGLDFFGTKMKNIVEEAEKILADHLPDDQSKKILVHCWRGGMRSAGIAWLLDLYGFKVYTLVGGYKRFRNYVLDTFTQPYFYKIIGGYTGSGKTGLLKILASKGQRVIDLEGIASHRGSAFGNIGMADQPGQEMFENKLGLALRQFSTEENEKPIWLEDESQRIGLVNIPNELWKKMRQAPLYFLDVPFEERLGEIVREYGPLDMDKLIGSITRISEKLGHLNAKNAISLLKEGKTRESFEILLHYYDKFYLRSLHNREQINSLLQTIPCKSITPENADLLITYPDTQPQES